MTDRSESKMEERMMEFYKSSADSFLAEPEEIVTLMKESRGTQTEKEMEEWEDENKCIVEIKEDD